jgi:hypothetical protein
VDELDTKTVTDADVRLAHAQLRRQDDSKEQESATHRPSYHLYILTNIGLLQRMID